MYPNRYICSVLEEMRACYKTRNFSGLLGLIEEAQALANRMEARLEDQADIEELLEKRDALYREVSALRKEKSALLNEEDVLA